MNKIYIFIIFNLIYFSSFSQNDSLSSIPVPNSTDTADGLGIAVSPSSFHLSIKPGSSAVKEISIFNDSKKNYKFQLTFHDFVMGPKGEVISTKPTDSKYALSKCISVSPSYFELKPKERKKIKLIISIPDSALFAMWTIVAIDEILERQPLAVPEANDKTIAFGIQNTMGFGISVFQNPPNVINNNVEIQEFKLTETDTIKRVVSMNVKNVGDGVGYSTVYIEYTNLSTGKTERTNANRFVILPQYSRQFFFTLPNDLPKGKYSLVGILDFGSKQEIKAAELDFEVDK